MAAIAASFSVIFAYMRSQIDEVSAVRRQDNAVTISMAEALNRVADVLAHLQGRVTEEHASMRANLATVVAIQRQIWLRDQEA